MPRDSVIGYLISGGLLLVGGWMYVGARGTEALVGLGLMGLGGVLLLVDRLF